MISPGLVLLTQQYKVDPDTVSAFMVGAIVLFTGSVTFFTASGANIWGKRPFFVISTLLLLISNVWGTFADVGGAYNVCFRNILTFTVFPLVGRNAYLPRNCLGSVRNSGYFYGF